MEPGQDPLIWLLGDGDLGMVRLLRMLAVAFMPYLLALGIAQRATGRYALIIAFATAVILGLTMLAMFPAGALDIFHNIMDGRLFWLYHINPTIYPPSAASGDPLFGYMHYWADTKTAYGPLWFLVTLPAVLVAGNNLTSNMVAYKALPFVFEIVSLGLIALIAQRIDPRKMVAAVVCFGWNPLVLWEIAGNGHNDIVMMCFALAAILLLLTDRWPWAFPVLACSVMVKYISAVLLPVFVLWVLLRHGRRAITPMIAGLLGGLLVALIVTLPFWAGPRTLAPLFGQEQDFIFSPASALIRQWGENIPSTPLVVGVKRALTALFAVLYIVAVLRLRRSPASLVRTCVEVLFLLLVLMTWWFWPWYVVWGLALAAILPSSPHSRLFVIFSGSVMLIYLSSPWRLSIWNFDSFFPLAIGTALFVFLPPVLYALMHLLDAVQPPTDEAVEAQHEALTP
jgi:alpha-1,6-mannosyltransferase